MSKMFQRKKWDAEPPRCSAKNHEPRVRYVVNTPFLRVQNGVAHLSVKVQPRASRNEVAGVAGSELKIRITAPPVDSAANEMLLRWVAEQLGCARNAVQLVRGGASRHKVIAIEGVSENTILERLALNTGR
jgi:uncharacterized protein